MLTLYTRSGHKFYVCNASWTRCTGERVKHFVIRFGIFDLPLSKVALRLVVESW